MPPDSFSEAIFQLPYNNEESILIEVFKALKLMVALGVNFCLVFFFFFHLQGSLVDLCVLSYAIVFLSTPIIPSLSFVLLLVY